MLACFIAGNTFTWDDWFRLETLDDSLQPTIDMLLNVSIFMWYGAVCPWDSFLHNEVIPLYRLVPLGILVLLLRRLPWVFAIHKKIPQIEQVRQAIFVGFFGPVGVSAIFYLYITNEFLETLKGSNGELREDVAKLPEAVTVIVWFLCITSVVSVVSPQKKRRKKDCLVSEHCLLILLYPGHPRIKYSLGQARLLLTPNHLAQRHRRPDRHRRKSCALSHWQPCQQHRPPLADVHHGSLVVTP